MIQSMPQLQTLQDAKTLTDLPKDLCLTMIIREVVSARARLRNMHKPHIFSMAQIQGVKTYEALRHRLSYFVL